jgi:hypothetical protein
MSRSQFLNPTVRILLCVTGAAIMAATLYPSIGGDFFADRANILRVLFFFGFLFFLMKEALRRLRGAPRPTRRGPPPTRTGQGQRVDIPMFETMASFVMGDHMGGLTYDPPLDKGGYARHLSRDRRPYKTSDGHICVIVYNDKQWENFFEATGRDDLRKDPKFATFAGRAGNIDHVYAELARILETRSTAEWMDILTRADVPVMPMHDLESLLADPHMVATDRFPVVEHPTEGRIRSMKVSANWSETPVETPGGGAGGGRGPPPPPKKKKKRKNTGPRTTTPTTATRVHLAELCHRCLGVIRSL